MRFFRRSLVALGVAAVLPTVVFAAVAIFYFLRLESNRVESDALRNAQVLMTLVDARLQRDMSALNVLTSSMYFRDGDLPDFYARAQRVLANNPEWATISLVDVRSSAEIFDLRRPVSAPRPLDASHLLPFTNAVERGSAVVGDIERDPEPLVWLYVPVPDSSGAHFVLRAAVRSQVFQSILVPQVPPGPVVAVVDHRGHFIARTLNYAQRVGQPGSEHLRAALGRHSKGFYRGVTLEGVSNYSAYFGSDWSGWSVHWALASSQIDTPISWSFVVVGLAALGSVLLGGVLVVLVLRDMADRRRAEETLRQSQKMEAVGQLTGGIAHDFNNLLTAIIGNLDLIRTRAAGNERLQRLAVNGLEAAQRGAKLASQLLAFSRSQRMAIASVDLEKLLEGMSGLLAQSVGPAITLRLSVTPDARYVLSDANQLELALLNLAVNARDAMPDGGELTIRADLAAATGLRHLPQTAYAQLCVTDNGVGMTEAVRARAIEPFFTTKAVGQGTGLGLSQVYAVVHESGGTLQLESSPGAGTTVRLLLPLAAGHTRPALVPREPNPTVPTAKVGEEPVVLVVDDDRLVRKFVTESLRSLGYRVVEASGGAEALKLMATARFNLLLADYAMPGMNGADLARAARQQQSDLRVLIVSGYADSAAIEAAVGSTRLLRKPFDLAALSAAVAEALQSS
jgi:signal transduction histidine kinase